MCGVDGVPVLKWLGYLWSAPYGLVGLAALAIAYRLSWVTAVARMDGGIHALMQGPLAARMLARGWGAFTLGWTIFYWETPDETLVRHELRHVRQCLWIGVLYPVVYLVLLAVYGYADNPLEKDARDHE